MTKRRLLPELDLKTGQVNGVGTKETEAVWGLISDLRNQGPRWCSAEQLMRAHRCIKRLCQIVETSSQHDWHAMDGMDGEKRPQMLRRTSTSM